MSCSFLGSGQNISLEECSKNVEKMTYKVGDLPVQMEGKNGK